MSDMNNYDDNNDEFDFLEYFFILLSFRRLIFLIFTTISVIGIISYYYSSIIYTTNATLLVDKDQTDPSSFISNNEFEFINDISLENEDQISLFKSTSILNNVIEQTGINYKHYSKKRFKLKTLLNVESLPFVFSFKSEGNQNKAEIDINKNYVKVKINDEIFSFAKNKAEFENSLFKYKSKSLNHIKNNNFIVQQLPYPEVMNELKEGLNINLTKNSNVYEISYSGPNPVINSKVLSSVVESIQEQNKRNKENIYRLSIDFITSRISELDNEIDSINLVISDYKVLNGVYMPEIQTNSALKNLNDIQQKIFNNNLQKELSYKLINELEKPDYFKLLPSDIGIDNHNINTMVNQFNQIIMEKNNLFEDATDKNPLLLQVQNQLKDLRTNIINTLNIYINKLEMTLSRYKDYKRKSNSIVGVIPIREAELGNLERDILLVNNLHSYLTQKKEEALISLYSMESNIKLINEVDYNVNIKSNKSQTLMLFLLAGFIFPIGFVFCVTCFKSLYVNLNYLKVKLGKINFLGIVKFTKENISNEDKLINNEFFKRIYYNIKTLFPKTDKGSSIMITSSIKNEGKTYTAFNLSKYLSSLDKKVILIGTDSRNPDLSKFFDNINSKNKGLTDIIFDHKNDFKELIEEYKITKNKFDTVLVGTAANNNFSIFQNERFNDLLLYLKKKYDYVIFDTAPIQFMVDPLELLEKSDIVVHVFRNAFSHKKTVDYMLEYKEKYNLNKIAYLITDNSKHDKLIDKYGYGYGYGY